MRQIISLVILLLTCVTGFAQQKYWVYFKDKQGGEPAVSARALENRRMLGIAEKHYSDIPVSAAYTNALQLHEVVPVCQSRWLNAISAVLNQQQYQEVQQLPFVEKIEPIDARLIIAGSNNTSPEYLGMALAQMNAGTFMDEGLYGQGMVIGIIDAGFQGATNNAALKHIFNQNRILGTRDLVNPKKQNFFGDQETMLDFHGTTVMKMIAGYDSLQKMQFGLARDASFYLARTDHGNHEFRGEEDYWVSAMEWMDSLGVRIINTSLGYALGFDKPEENYSPSQMDGKSSVIARAAQIAAEEKGMLVIVSAGNDGNNKNWRYISTPADAPGVLSVGATPGSLRERISYSGIGPEYLSYIKPNVACYSLTGTSFSAPVIAGLSACLMQKNPSLTNKQIIEIIEKSGHLYPYGNNFLGYGVPNSEKALALAADPGLALPATNQEIKVKGGKVKLTMEGDDSEGVVIFHKKNKFIVVKQESYKTKKKSVEVKRFESVQRSTVDLGGKVVEIIWE